MSASLKRGKRHKCYDLTHPPCLSRPSLTSALLGEVPGMVQNILALGQVVRDLWWYEKMEGLQPRHDLERHHTRRVDIAPVLPFLAIQHLQRHVRRGAHHRRRSWPHEQTSECGENGGKGSPVRGTYPGQTNSSASPASQDRPPRGQSPLAATMVCNVRERLPFQHHMIPHLPRPLPDMASSAP